MKKKVLIRMMAACMAVAVLTGCGASNSTQATNNRHDNNRQEREESEKDYSNKEDSGKGQTADAAPAATNDAACVEEYDGYDGYILDEGYYYDGDYSESDCDDYWYYDNNESYAHVKENGFLSVEDYPYSTFSADVDTASYSNVRRMIMDGYAPSWIDSDAVRIEEMINYFSYDYDGPRRNEPFGVNTEIVECPWNEDTYLLRVGLQTDTVDFEDIPAMNLVFLIDVSGSMYSDDKLPLLQKAFEMLCTNLSARDRVSIVTYAGDDQIVIQGVKGNETDVLIEAIESLEAGGSTNGSAGIITAYELAEKYYIEGGNNRVILATDGDLNVGVTSNSGLEDLISDEKETGVYLSVLGFGTGNLKDDKMETLADKGNGNYSYIDSLKEAKKVLINEMGATLITVAKDVKFQIEFNDDVVASYRQIGYENRALADEDFEDDSKDAGEVGAGCSVTVLYEIALAGKSSKALDNDKWCTLYVRYKEPDGDKSRELDYNIGGDDYSRHISKDTAMAAAVAEFGMILKSSKYAGDSSEKAIYELLEEADIKGDEYKEEFQEIVEIYFEAYDEWMYYYCD